MHTIARAIRKIALIGLVNTLVLAAGVPGTSWGLKNIVSPVETMIFQNLPGHCLVMCSVPKSLFLMALSLNI